MLYDSLAKVWRGNYLVVCVRNYVNVFCWFCCYFCTIGAKLVARLLMLHDSGEICSVYKL